MKHNWEYKPFKQLSDILYGCPFESEFFNSESKGMPLIRIRDVKPGYTSTYFNGGYSDDYIIKKGDYLIGMDGEFNIAPWQSEDALLNQRVCRVKSINENVILSNFIYYFLGKELKDIEAQTSFVTVKHLSAKVLNAINTPVPPMEVQEQIVAELDKINETIEDCRELLRNLDALAQSLFYDTFGDPTTFHNRWEISTLGENCTFIGGGTPSKSNADFYSGNIPWATVRDMSNFLLSSTELKITEEAIKLSATNLLPKGTIVISTHVGLGKICKLMQDTAINQDLKGVILNERLIDTFFVYWYINMAPHIIANGRGATVKGVTLDFMRSLKIPVPPISLQEQFAERIEQIEEQKKIVENTIAELQTLLDSRMDYWFN